MKILTILLFFFKLLLFSKFIESFSFDYGKFGIIDENINEYTKNSLRNTKSNFIRNSILTTNSTCRLYLYNNLITNSSLSNCIVRASSLNINIDSIRERAYYYNGIFVCSHKDLEILNILKNQESYKLTRDSQIKGLQCFAHTLSNKFVISPIGDNTIHTFDIKTKTFSQFFKLNYKNNGELKILKTVSTSRYYESSCVIFIISRDNVFTYIHKIEFPNQDEGDFSFFENEKITLNSKIELSFTNEKLDTLIIVTYDVGVFKSLKYYFFNLEARSLSQINYNLGPNLNFNPYYFEFYSISPIYSASFVTESGLNSTVTGDIRFENYFQITTTPAVIHNIIIFKNNNLIAIDINGNLTQFCGLYTNEGRCILPRKCPPGTYPIMNLSSLSNSNRTCVGCDQGFVYESYCVESCPSSLHPIVNENKRRCRDCNKNGKLYLFKGYKCVDTCPLGFMQKEGTSICYPCSYYDRFIYKSTCVRVCPSGTILKNSTCEICKDLAMYNLYGSCKEKCPMGFFTKNYVCIECPNNLPYYFRSTGECFSKCPDKTVENKINKTCDECNSDYPYMNNFDSSCVKECPKNLKLNKNNTCTDCLSSLDSLLINGTCITCGPENKFYNYLENKCVAICPNNTEVDYLERSCKLCKLPNCGKSSLCPDDALIVENKCIICNHTTPFYSFSDKSCKSSCPNNSIIDKNRRACYYCETFSNTTYYFNQTCVSRCEEFGLCNKIENNLRVCSFCNECHEKGELKENGICVKNCSVGYYADNLSKTCVNCASSKLFYFDGKCVANCPDKYFSNNENICNYCNYIYDDNCVPNCPYLYAPLETIIPRKCVKCLDIPDKKYYYKGKCYNTCPPDTKQDYMNFICRIDNSIFNLKDLKCQNNGTLEYNEKTNKHNCKCLEQYSGDICEIFRPLNNKIRIEINNSKDGLLSSNELIFDYIYDGNKPKNYELTWTALSDNNYINDNFFINGKNQEKLKIKKQGLNSEAIIVKLCFNNNSTGEILQDKMVIKIDKTEVEFYCDINYYEGERQVSSGVSKRTLIKIEILPKNNEMKEILKYTTMEFFYEDYNKNAVYLSDDNYSSNIYISDKFPPTNKIIVKYKIGFYSMFNKLECPINIEKNPDIDTSRIVKQIITDSSNLSNLRTLNYAISNSNTSLDPKNIENIKNYLSKSFDNMVSSDNSKVDHTLFLSLCNTISNQNMDNNSDALNSMNNLVSKMINTVNKSNKDLKLSSLEVDTYYKTFDQFYHKFSKVLDTKRRILQESNSNISSNKTDIESEIKEIFKLKNSIINMNEYLSRNLDPNEKIFVSTTNFHSIINKFSSKNSNDIFKIEKDKNKLRILNSKTDLIHSIAYENSNNISNTNSSCHEDNLICINSKSMDKLRKIFEYSNISSIDSTSAIMLDSSSNLLSKNQGEYLTENSVYFDLYDSNTKNASAYFQNLLYDINMDLRNVSKDYLINATCINIEASLSNPTCRTYYNYKTNKVICKCRGPGEIVNVFNLTATNFAKVLQFPPFDMNMINPLSLCITIGSLTIVIIFSIILNILDFIDDNKTIEDNDTDDHTIIKNEFKDVESLQNANYVGFAFYVTLYAYPFFGVFSLYKYDHPRFIRFWIEVLHILLNLTVSLLPYYKKNFSYGDEIVNRRDIEEESLSLDNLPIRISDILDNIVYSIIGSAIISILMAIFLSIIQWEKFIEKSWKNRKNMIKKYIRVYMIKPLILPDFWKSIRIRLLAYYRICGKSIINKRKKENSLLDEKNYDNDSNFDFNDSKTNLKNSNTYFIILELLPEEKKNEQCFIELTEIKIDVPKSDTCNKKTTNESNFTFCHDQHFCLNISSSSYFQKKMNKKKEIVRSNISSLKSNSSTTIKKFSHFTLRRKREIEFQIVFIKKRIGGSGLDRERYLFVKSIMTFLIILVFYGIIYTILIVMIFDIYNSFRHYIIKIWLVPSLLQLLVISFFINYLTNLSFSFLCFYKYKIRKSSRVLRFIFRFIIPQYTVNMYKIRNFVTKYYKKINIKESRE